MSGTNGGKGQAPASEGPGSGERPEREATRTEVAEPRGRPQQARRRRFSWRTPVAVLLIIVGCVLAPLSVVAVWTANQVSDTSSVRRQRDAADQGPGDPERPHQQAHQRDRHQDRCEGADRSGGRRTVAEGLHPDRRAAAGRVRLARQRGAGIRAQPHPQDHHRPADGERVGPGEPGRPPGSSSPSCPAAAARTAPSASATARSPSTWRRWRPSPSRTSSRAG